MGKIKMFTRFFSASILRFIGGISLLACANAVVAGENVKRAPSCQNGAATCKPWEREWGGNQINAGDVVTDDGSLTKTYRPMPSGSNPFDKFDTPAQAQAPETGNPFDKFDKVLPKATRPAKPRRLVRSGSACESGHWIDEVMSDGELVKLEDGSLWEVAGGDEITSALWLPTTDIVVCNDKLINTDDNESVEATRIR